MKINDMVVSLELAKRLKKLGVTQNSLFYYQNNPYNDGEDCIDLMIKELVSKNGENAIMNSECENDSYPKYSAFTASELVEILPKYINDYDIFLTFNTKVDKKWEVYYGGDGYDGIIYFFTPIADENVHDALAKLLIHLIENNLWRPE